MKTDEQLRDCPACGGNNFTAKGLKSHNCERRQARAKSLKLPAPITTKAQLESRKPLSLEEREAIILNLGKSIKNAYRRLKRRDREDRLWREGAAVARSRSSSARPVPPRRGSAPGGDRAKGGPAPH